MGKQQGGPAPFLTKTHLMVEDPETDEVLGWTEKGQSFVVWKPVELARDLLPRHFKHNNFSSFVRQLNTYGFRKVVPDRWEFANDNFRRGERTLLSAIQRRKPLPCSSINKSPPSISSREEEHSSATSSAPPRDSTQENLRHRLSKENEMLKRHNGFLTSELSQARKRCETLLGRLSKYVDVIDLDATAVTKKAPRLAIRTEEEQRKDDEGQGMRLFGVCLGVGFGPEDKQRKRARCDHGRGDGRTTKANPLAAPLLELCANHL